MWCLVLIRKIPLVFTFSNAKHCSNTSNTNSNNDKNTEKSGGHRGGLFLRSTVKNTKISKFYIYFRTTEKLVSDSQAYVIIFCGAFKFIISLDQTSPTKLN